MSAYGFNCTQLPFLTGFAPMVECVYRDSGLGNDDGDLVEASRFEMQADETVVLGAHFDSRGVKRKRRSAVHSFVRLTEANSAVLRLPDCSGR